MTIYLLICKSGSSIHLDFFFWGGGHVSRMRCSSVNASPPRITFDPRQPLSGATEDMYSQVLMLLSYCLVGKNLWIEVEHLWWSNSSNDKKMNQKHINHMNHHTESECASRLHTKIPGAWVWLPFVWWENQQLSQPNAASRFDSGGIPSSWICCRKIPRSCAQSATETRQKIWIFWDEIAAVCFGWTMWCLVCFSVECNHLVYSRFVISVRDMI